MKSGFKWFIGVSSFFGLLFFISSFGNPKSTKEGTVAPEVEDERSLPQIVRSVTLEKDFIFAGEKAPLQNFDAQERLERELLVNSYWHSSTILNLKASGRYFPVMKPILARHGVPEDFVYLAVAESNLRNAVSPAGAKGLWQFMKSAGEHFDLEINSEVDERYHLEKSTEAAARYLRQLHERFGSWTLAAAAYNAGPTKISSLLKEQRAVTYYDLNLNEETSRYVFRLFAIKEIFENSRQYGFYLTEEDYYQPLEDYTVVKVNSSVENLGDFANKYGTSYRLLKVYNPWLIDATLSNRSRKTYEIKVPKQ